MPKTRITDRAIAALKGGATLWDTDVQGLGARKRRDDGRVTFVLKFRSPVEQDGTGRGKQRMVTIGRRGRGDWGIDDARKEATGLRLILRSGRDPAIDRGAERAMPTVSELAETYLMAATAGELLTKGSAKRASTLATDRSRIDAHIRPLLGNMKVDAVTSQDIRRAMHAIAAGKTATVRTSGRGAPTRGGRGAASRTIGLAGALFSYAVREGLRADNPVRGVERYADGRRARRLSDAEYAALGSALRAAPGSGLWPAAIAATRMLLLSGWRLGEVISLQWQDVDLNARAATLGVTKTGRSQRPLSVASCILLRSLPTGGRLIFPAARGEGSMTGFRGVFNRLASLAALPADVTPHVLRHSFASLAGDLGLSDPTIAALIGHRSGSMTSKYTHLADAPLLAAADRVAAETMRRLGESE